MLCLTGASHLYFIAYIELKPGLLSGAGAPMKQRLQAELGGGRERRSVSGLQKADRSSPQPHGSIINKTVNHVCVRWICSR